MLRWSVEKVGDVTALRGVVAADVTRCSALRVVSGPFVPISRSPERASFDPPTPKSEQGTQPKAAGFTTNQRGITPSGLRPSRGLLVTALSHGVIV
jgi:hypothetical protein